MADGTAPAIDKVGEPEPTAPEAQAGAPATDAAAAAVPPPPAPAESAKSEEEEKKIEEGAGPAIGFPKPVEIMSVPETPINNRTPAGGSPRPELKINEEPKEPAKENQNVVIEPIEDPAKDGKPSEKEINGATEEVDMKGQKRKAQEEAPAATGTNGDALKIESDKADTDGPPEKKAKIDDEGKNGKTEKKPATNGKHGPGRPKKKDRPMSAGKTARKTRSQGPVEV